MQAVTAKQTKNTATQIQHIHALGQFEFSISIWMTHTAGTSDPRQLSRAHRVCVFSCMYYNCTSAPSVALN
jgi:hypothetical protein